MLSAAISLALLACLLWLLLFPATVPRLLRRAGGTVGGAGRAGQELLTGERVKGSPLARYEAVAGRTVEEKLLAQYPPCPDPALQARVARVGSRLAQSALRHEIPWRFLVLEGAEPHGYSLPGGAILVTRPLVDLSGGDDNQLAGVLAHEVVHIDRFHAVRHLAAAAAARTGLRVLTFGRGAILSRAVGAMEGLLEKGYGHDQEIEADQLGAKLAASAGFDPRAFPYFLRGVAARRAESAGYFRAHPPIAERLRALGD